LQYEIIKDINNLNASSGMKNLRNNILGKFLSSNDYNLKYIALNIERLSKCTKTSFSDIRIS